MVVTLEQMDRHGIRLSPHTIGKHLQRDKKWRIISTSRWVGIWTNYANLATGTGKGVKFKDIMSSKSEELLENTLSKVLVVPDFKVSQQQWLMLSYLQAAPGWYSLWHALAGAAKTTTCAILTYALINKDHSVWIVASQNEIVDTTTVLFQGMLLGSKSGKQAVRLHRKDSMFAYFKYVLFGSQSAPSHRLTDLLPDEGFMEARSIMEHLKASTMSGNRKGSSMTALELRPVQYIVQRWKLETLETPEWLVLKPKLVTSTILVPTLESQPWMPDEGEQMVTETDTSHKGKPRPSPDSIEAHNDQVASLLQ